LPQDLHSVQVHLIIQDIFFSNENPHSDLLINLHRYLSREKSNNSHRKAKEALVKVVIFFLILSPLTDLRVKIMPNFMTHL
jgi:hypothetical protein